MDEEAVFDRYYNLSLRFLSYRPRSEKEVLDYLAKKALRAPSLTPEIVVKIMARLQQYHFIDDPEFAKFWVGQRTKYKHKPVRVIRFELLQKGIDRDLIDSLLDNHNETDLESAKKLAEKKLDFYRNLDPLKRREKVMNYLLRKGFSYDTVKKVISFEDF